MTLEAWTRARWLDKDKQMIPERSEKHALGDLSSDRAGFVGVGVVANDLGREHDDRINK